MCVSPYLKLTRMKTTLISLFICVSWIVATTWAVSDRNHAVDINKANIASLTVSLKSLTTSVELDRLNATRSEVRQEAILETLKEIKEELKQSR